MSRIDNATLQLTLTGQAVTGGRSCKVRVFAVNYNVLRIMSGYALATKTYMRIHVSSDLQKANCKIVCCEKALKPITPSWCFTHQWQREKNFGMGKVNWMTTIGNSHTSQKRCQRLNDDCYLKQVQMLKVQSSLQGNLKGYTDGWS
jgi:hypothetical protein